MIDTCCHHAKRHIHMCFLLADNLLFGFFRPNSFDSVLGMEHEGMVSMFEALLLSGLNGFLGCSSATHKAALVEFFHKASVRDGKVASTVQGKHVSILEELFAGTFELSLEGLSYLHELPQDFVFEARNAFSYDDKLLSTSCKKREMTFEFRLLNDVLAKSVTMETDMEEPSLTRSDDIIVEITKRSIAVNDEDDNLDRAENEIARKMAYFTAPKQFLKESLISGEDDDLSGSKQPRMIIETVEETEKDKEIEPVTTEDLSLAKSVATMTDSEDTKPLRKVLELTEKSKSDEESMSIEDILKQIPEGMIQPSLTAAEITRINSNLALRFRESTKVISTRPV
ncbi:splicing factor 3B subunit 1-like [Dorcoceras hygrometricum]|uniref:Splicing factor 3B subunit 1-like n=1 Tax=Dorcoceras hygrometricum TaxID=472368 RepID=A0A2Z7BML7_9LAMI|nr:splicing factor 3B subunit 1-like [Dorcoceras hygrometricum]